jgi:hypothetical protein
MPVITPTPTPETCAEVERDYPDEPDAKKWRLAVAAQMLKDYEEANGRPARTTEELAAWLRVH